MNKDEILNQGDEYASEHWSACDSPNEHDNAREDFIAGALWVFRNLVKIKNAYIEDAEILDSYDVTGRVKELWITKEDFDKIKCINN